MAPLQNHSVADIGDVPLSSRYDLAACHKDIQAFVTSLVVADIVPLSVGGDHSISLPLLRAVGKDRPVGMIQIDAHCDTSGSFEGCKFHHGGPFRQAVLDGVLDPERTIQIGIRGNADYLWEFSYDSGMTVIHAEEAIAMGPAAIVKRIRQVMGNGPTYVTFDVDGLDPGLAPGTGTPGSGRFDAPSGRPGDSEGLPSVSTWSAATSSKSRLNTTRRQIRRRSPRKPYSPFCALPQARGKLAEPRRRRVERALLQVRSVSGDIARRAVGGFPLCVLIPAEDRFLAFTVRSQG